MTTGNIWTIQIPDLNRIQIVTVILHFEGENIGSVNAALRCQQSISSLLHKENYIL